MGKTRNRQTGCCKAFTRGLTPPLLLPIMLKFEQLNRPARLGYTYVHTSHEGEDRRGAGGTRRAATGPRFRPPRSGKDRSKRAVSRNGVRKGEQCEHSEKIFSVLCPAFFTCFPRSPLRCRLPAVFSRLVSACRSALRGLNRADGSSALPRASTTDLARSVNRMSPFRVLARGTTVTQSLGQREDLPPSAATCGMISC